MRFKNLFIAAVIAFAVCALSACVKDWTPEELEAQRRAEATKQSSNPGLFGDGGMFGGGKGDSSGIGVNSFLWRASLDTISFMPVSSVDPFGGVIITDWHSAAEAPSERFKINIYILGKALRADGVRVAVFRQVQSDGLWKDATVPETTGARIEDSILTRARQLRHETMQK